jgi:hypothetical protein
MELNKNEVKLRFNELIDMELNTPQLEIMKTGNIRIVEVNENKFYIEFELE